jgi:hypothetical protein
MQTFWLWMIARQNSPYLMASIVVTIVLLAANALQKWPSAKGTLSKGLLGAGIGYVAALVAALASECALRGEACLIRDFSASFYFFPIVSFAWLYGAVATLLAAKHCAR